MVNEPDPQPEHVPDAVLDELMAAFSKERDDSAEKAFDFDDPSIDRLLALDLDDDDDDDDDDVDDDDDDDDIVLDDDEVTLAPEPESEAHAEPPPAPPVEAAAPRKTIVIDHEEQPDTVYLDADPQDQSGERATVVIGDLDDGAVAEPAPVAGSAGGVGSGSMDPRIRARRIANRRAEGRRRLIWVAVASAVVLLLVAAVAVVASPIFDVRDVVVQGAVYTDPDVLQEVVDSIHGDPVLLVDTEAAEQRLEAVPWVERARVTTDFPHTVVIDIRERKPVATFQGGDEQFRVIDVQGRVLDVIEGQPIAYPLITGTHPDTARGQFAGSPYASAGQLVIALPPEVRSNLVSVGVDSSTGSLSLVLRSPDDTNSADIDVRLGDDSGLDDKLARLLYQVRTGLEGVCSIDVSTAEVGVVPGC
ncbi:MAG: FtsQ-type POTRA domain-containing protein [Actinobacteria bacterium]|nr:FtsQ-type POTRA domain-containing protein [Actinomycetota bacterium]